MSGLPDIDFRESSRGDGYGYLRRRLEGNRQEMEQGGSMAGDRRDLRHGHSENGLLEEPTATEIPLATSVGESPGRNR